MYKVKTSHPVKTLVWPSSCCPILIGHLLAVCRISVSFF